MTATDLILAIDQGTTGSTCLVVDAALRVHGRSTVEFPQHFPKPGWVEHDPDELWTSIVTALGQALSAADADATRISAIGITNQRETTLVWDRASGEPLHRAIVWQDRRTFEHCARLRAQGHEDLIRAETGLVPDPYFSGTKLGWLLDNVEGARARAEAGDLAAGTIDTYVLWRLTDGAVHATEPGNASRTMLWPLRGGGWSEAMCELLGVPAAMLPEVHPSAHAFGHTKGVPGLPDGIPICGIAGDQQSALFGQACFAPGEAKCTYGTGAFVMMNTGSEIVPSSHGLLTTVGWEVDGTTTYCLEGSAFMAGAVVQWLRDELGFFSSAAEVEALARTVDDAGGVILVPAHAGLGAPHWRPEARGLIRGLTRGTGRAHIARAALEGIALQITDLLEAMAADLGKPIAGLRVDGGAAANNLLMQIQANLVGLPLQRPTMLEATALGAISLAGLGAGIFSDTTSLREAWVQDRAFSPAGDAEALASLRKAWSESVALA